MSYRRPRLLMSLCLFLMGGALISRTAAAQGNAGAASFQIPPGARAEGMGRTFSAVADDAFAPWWNPGGLAFIEGKNAALMHAKLVPGLADDVYFEYASYAQHLSGWGGVALTLTYLNYGTSQITNEGSPDPVGTFHSFEIAPSVAIGTAISHSLGIGANLKFLHVDLAPETADQTSSGKGSTFAVDAGALWKVPAMPVNLAAVVQNIGPNITLNPTKPGDPLPRTLRLGAAWQVINKGQHSVLVAFDGDKVLLSNSATAAADSTVKQTWFDRNNVLLNVGGEYTFNNLVSLRLGYIFDDPGEVKDLTSGLGVTYKGISFDYASIPQYTELDRVSKFSISARF